MSELPRGWIIATLNDVTINHDGKRVPVRATDRQHRQGQYPYYGASGVIDTVDDFLFDGNFLLVAEDGANLLARSTPIAFQAHGKFWVNNHAHVIDSTDACSNGYLERYLNSLDLARYVTGSAQPKLTQKALNSIPVPIAPLREQTCIVSKLDSLLARSSRARHELDLVPNLIERYKQAILAKAFSGDLTADWRQANSAPSSADLLVQRAKAASGTTRPSKQVTRKLLSDATLPSSWASERLENLCSLIVDGTHFTPAYTTQGVPFISVKDIRNNKIHFDNCRYVSEPTHDELSARCNPTQGDILLTKSGTIGRLAVVPEGPPFSLFVSVALLRPAIPDLIPEFLMHALEFWVGTIDVSQEIVGSAIKNLHLQDIKALEAPVPPAEEQVEILRRLTHMFAWLDKITTEHARADHLLPKLNQAILAKAFRGELIPQDPNDEPASALLERICAERNDDAKPQQRRGRG